MSDEELEALLKELGDLPQLDPEVRFLAGASCCY